jgi:phosphoribosylformylglycinamidine synthase
MIGICNGFQVLVQVGLLPGPSGPSNFSSWPDQPPPQTLALSDNKDARYMCRWVDVSYNAASPCVWTKGLDSLAHDDESRRANHTLPVGHGEGRLSAASPGIIEHLELSNQIAVRYADNFNGSEAAIAGVCDATGRIFGLMPHPDRFLSWTRHPFWTRLSPGARKGDTPGLRMFKNAVEVAAAIHA